jgi:hypothetical protein
MDETNADEIVIQTHWYNRINWHNAFREYWKDAYGWSGSLAVIIAYGMITFADEEDEERWSRKISLLNIYGSLAIGYVCCQAKVWQALFLEVGWFSIAIYSLILEK